ncbi:hypothetical protein ACQ902_000001, partial [Vibrio mimicus]
EIPRFPGVNQNQEILSFVAGNTYNYPLVGAIATNDALMSAGKLRRKIHDSTASLLEQLDVRLSASKPTIFAFGLKSSAQKPTPR